jgi:hypothetical protein
LVVQNLFELSTFEQLSTHCSTYDCRRRVGRGCGKHHDLTRIWCLQAGLKAAKYILSQPKFADHGGEFCRCCPIPSAPISTLCCAALRCFAAPRPLPVANAVLRMLPTTEQLFVV